MDLQKWRTQLRKGLLDLLVLNFLKRREYYGYDLVQELKQIDGLRMREGTIYPILARMQEDGLVRSEIRPSDAGPPRKYFGITAAGRKAVEEMNQHWGLVERAVEIALRRTQEARNER
jgi:PadR family transcriptional regulator PadR